MESHIESINNLIDSMDISAVEQAAYKKIYQEEFEKKVEEKVQELLTKKSLRDKMFPYKLVLLSSDDANKLNKLKGK